MAAWDKDLDPVRPAWEADLDPPTASGGINQTLGNIAAGAVRGAGSIGATILGARDAAEQKIADMMGAKGYVAGVPNRRQAMDSALSSMGAEPDSFAFKGGKLAGEIAGTLGAGGLAAQGATRVPGLAAAAPGMLNAIRTSGMQAGGGGALSNLAARTVGGGIAGGAAAGIVNPEDAGIGALIGGAMPGAMKLAGAVGGKIGGAMRGPAQPAQLSQAVSAARAAGYVIPPTQARPTLVNLALEGLSGKITTAQNASAKNQPVTNRLATEALGLPQGTQLTPGVLEGVRDTAGKAYEAIGSTGIVQPTAAYGAALDRITKPFRTAAAGFPNAKPSPVLEMVDALRSPHFDAASGVAKIKELRSAADDAFRIGNTDMARASKAASRALEDAMEAHLASTGQATLLKSFRDSRVLIAKTYSVEKALNPASGSVDARKLAAQLAKGKPLSGELKQAANFGAQFPKASQTIEGMGSLPQTSPLDWGIGGGLSLASANIAPLALMMTRPAARAAALSPSVQNRLVQGAQAPGIMQRLFASPELQSLGYRSAPVLAADR